MTPPPDGDCLVVNPSHWSTGVQGIKEDSELDMSFVERISLLKLVDNDPKSDWNSNDIVNEDKVSIKDENSSNFASDLGSSLSSSDPSFTTSVSKEEVLSSGFKDQLSVSENESVYVKANSENASQQHHKCRCTCAVKKSQNTNHTKPLTHCAHKQSNNTDNTHPNKEHPNHHHASKCSKTNSGNNQGKWVSPSEFFQATRSRSSALANKVSTTLALAGSRELLTQDLLRVGAKDKDNKSVDDITKALQQANLQEKAKNVETSETVAATGELIQRSPIPALQGNRHLATPYTLAPKPQQPQQRRSNDYINYQQSVTNQPLQFIQQQRQRQPQQLKCYGAQQQQYVDQQQQLQNMYSMPAYYQQQQLDQNQMLANQEDYNNACCYNQEPLQQHQAVDNSYVNAYQQQYQNQNANNPYSPCTVNSQYSPYSIGRSPSEDSAYYTSPAAQQVESPVAYVSGSGTPNQSTFCNNGAMVFPNGSGGAAPTNQEIPFADEHLTTDELNRLLNNNQLAELPEALSDFILKYSRRYSVSSDQGQTHGASCHKGDEVKTTELVCESHSSRKGSTSSDEGYHGLSSVENVDDQSVCDSPFTAGSTPGCSPAAPQGGQTPTTPTKKSMNEEKKDLTPKSVKKIKPKPNNASTPVLRVGKAKQKMREMMSNEEFDNAWAWAVRCSQACPGALYYRDPDGDSLLHIVVWHKDLSKIYALTELMMRDETQPCLKPFDLPNKLDETPLFLAVEKRIEEVVAYALENAANPNQRTRNRDGDAALHYAASRGMTEIVQALCSSPLTNLNLLNVAGLTPLLCAVKNHGVIEEESQCLVNNKPTIRILLKAGADPKIPDASTGKTVLHYSVERMDPDLVQLFRDHLDKESMCTLVNMPTYTGETALHILGRMASPRGASYSRGEGEEELRRKMFMTLVDCGADITLCESPDPSEAQFTLLDPSLSP